MIASTPMGLAGTPRFATVGSGDSGRGEPIEAAALLWQMANNDSLSDEQFEKFLSAVLKTETAIKKQISGFIHGRTK